MRIFIKLTLSLILFSALILPFNYEVITRSVATGYCFSFSQENLSEICDEKNIEKVEKNSSEDVYMALLEKCENYFEIEIVKIKKDVAKTGSEKTTLEKKIKNLNSKIKSLNYEISQNNIMVKDLGSQINDTVDSIGRTTTEIEDTRIGLAGILREINQEDKRSVIELLFAEEKISDFYNNLAALEVLNSEIKNEVKNIKDLKSYLETQKDTLGGDREELKNVVWAQEFKKGQSQETKEEQANLLKKTKGEEALYQKHLEETEEKAKEIRQRIFQLAQIPEAQELNLEEAYQIAVYVESVTGIRPALLLGLLKIESGIGQNVGQCNCATHIGCKYPDLTYKKVMRSNQWDSFEKITNELGMDINATPVSCYVSGGKVQMGGAMGPAQFMPNTWIGKGLNYGYKEKVEAITKEIPANPWKVRDAFLAMGLYLKDFNADNQKLHTEKGAVTAYLCGSPRMTAVCKKSGGERYVNGYYRKEKFPPYKKIYRPGVMAYAAIYQKYVDDGVFD